MDPLDPPVQKATLVQMVNLDLKVQLARLVHEDPLAVTTIIMPAHTTKQL